MKLAFAALLLSFSVYSQEYGGMGFEFRSLSMKTSQLGAFGPQEDNYKKNQLSFVIAGMAQESDAGNYLYFRTTLLSLVPGLSWNKESEFSSKVGYNQEWLRFDWSGNITQGDVFKLQLGTHFVFKREGMNTFSGVLQDEGEEFIHHNKKYGAYGNGSGVYRTRLRAELGPTVGAALYFDNFGARYAFSPGLATGGWYMSHEVNVIFDVIDDGLSVYAYFRGQKTNLKGGLRDENEVLEYPDVKLRSTEFGIGIVTALGLF